MCRLLFGKTFSFDHQEFHLTCARSYNEHVALKEYTLEHTKPIYLMNKKYEPSRSVHKYHAAYIYGTF